MPADVVQRVDRLCRRPLNLTTLEFADRAGVLPDAAPLDDADIQQEPNNEMMMMIMMMISILTLLTTPRSQEWMMK